MTRFLRRASATLFLSLAALALVVPAASAHPLGNFTINHYTGLRVTTSAVLIDHITDFAEIPTFSERQVMDTDADGTISAAEAANYQAAACTTLATTLRLTAGGQPLPLVPTHTGLHFALGQGSEVMRLVCEFRATLTLPAAGTQLEFSDPSYAERRGWREIVVEGDGTTVSASDAPALGISDRLTAYPDELLALPLNQSSARFEARPGGPALPALTYPDSTPIGNVLPVRPAVEPVGAPAPAIPGGTTDLGADVTALFQAPDLTPPIIVLSLLVAAGLGALHALSPGHGKTVMAAYLVGSQGTMRQAVGLGMTVTVSHTLGVLALGALSLSAAAIIPPERLYPILGVVSGAIVIVIGAYLLLTRLRAMRPRHDHGHDHGHYHGHHHAEEHRPAGWHEHDGMGHTHLPQPGMGRRGLFALGLSGGMVPSVSALLVLLGSIAIGRPLFGIVLTVAFGIGMAFVLVGVGLALVYARKFVERLPVRSPVAIGKRLPVLTAGIVVLAGVLILGQGVAGLG